MEILLTSLTAKDRFWVQTREPKTAVVWRSGIFVVYFAENGSWLVLSERSLDFNKEPGVMDIYLRGDKVQVIVRLSFFRICFIFGLGTCYL